MIRTGSATERAGDSDLEDVEWELLCSAREAIVGFVPAPREQGWAALRTAVASRPWEPGRGPAEVGRHRL